MAIFDLKSHDLKKYMEDGKIAEELSPTKIEQLNKMPIIESTVGKSDDGKWIIHKTIITSIKPTKYYEKMLENV